VTLQSTALGSVEMVVDKMHMKGHTDPWCKENSDANKFEELHKICDAPLCKLAMNWGIILLQVDTEVCEQVFSWLSKYS